MLGDASTCAEGRNGQLRRQSRRTRRGGPGCESSRVIRTRRGGKATRPTGREESGLGIDQRAEYFIGATNQAGAECGVVLAELQLDQLLADLGQRLGTVDRRQAGGGDRRSSLIDSLLGALVGAQAGAKKTVGDLHGRLRRRIASIQADGVVSGKADVPARPIASAQRPARPTPPPGAARGLGRAPAAARRASRGSRPAVTWRDR